MQKPYFKKGLGEIGKKFAKGLKIKGVGSTGSARHLTGILVGADTVKSEIIAHAVCSGMRCAWAFAQAPDHSGHSRASL